MKHFFEAIQKKIEALVNKSGFGLRTKLIILFVIIKVIPLVLLAIMAWRQALKLTQTLEERTAILAARAGDALVETGKIAVNDSVEALNAGVTNEIERMSTDLALRVASFLYARDADIRYAALLPPSVSQYRNFLSAHTSQVVKQREWVLSEDEKSWVPKEPLPAGNATFSSNPENKTGYRNRPPDAFEYETRPLFLEMTFIDTAGNEIVKVTTSPQMDGRRKNVADRLNTYVKAESYWPELRLLAPGEIYVSDVIGAYVGSRLIGMYNPASVRERGLVWQPEKEAYAGRENPNGRRFKGIIRWAMPVIENGVRTGYVTLALDHDHIMEFVDHITPMAERYVEMPSAFEGNYAFIWDYRCRSICHPRHHSIVGFNPETGEPELPWLEESIYRDWQASGKKYGDFIKDVPAFTGQSREKKPAAELTAAGLVGLDGRYLNNAPQCTGWFDLTAEGGSGSFLILWSGIWKPNTAAAIRYYTHHYGNTRRGFGFVAIGAGLEDFQKPARRTERVLGALINESNAAISRAAEDTRLLINRNFIGNTLSLAATAAVMIAIVVLIAFWMADVLTKNLSLLIKGISRFRSGERQFRFNAPVKDEIGELADSFDEMAEGINASVKGPLAIIDMNERIIYINEGGLKAYHRTLDEVQGKPYSSISVYPANTPYDPILALKENRVSEVLYRPETDSYIRGTASWQTDKNGERTGIIIATIDVSELVRSQKELEKAVQNANLANQHKGDFLARMSHEIRTPMNAIIGMTEIVKKKMAEISAPIMDDLKQIEISSQHLLGLINDILDISKIEAGKIELNFEAVDLLKLARMVETIIRPRCEEKNITFTVSFSLNPPAAYLADPLRLRQVLINLLGNAVKFTPECGSITFSIVQRAETDDKTIISFAVSDNGIGISKEAQKSLFKPFEQTSSDISKRYGGTGLGLAISQSIIQILGGEIRVESEEGAGSVFTFDLALARTEAPEEVAVPSDAEGKLKGKRALLVDDVAINRIILINLLEYTGLQIEEAEDGAAALRCFSDSPPHYYDIIYMDVQMPVLDGYSASRGIRAMDREDAKTVPIVALTANAFKEDIDKALENGMNAHLAKPVEMDKCLEITFRLIRLRR
ncbi:MAG: response regulator [Treponema sp.]|jgi:signal transduction histidine kinase/CheY-like chemotaxis protein/HAMP domain-containing protein|nr:response regulator [Treponema sp.]